MNKRTFYVYIITNFKNTVLYIGLTNDLSRRLFEHRRGLIKGFTQKYKVYKLLYFEEYEYIYDAINREKQLKGWRREKKIELIKTINPDFRELRFESN